MADAWYLDDCAVETRLARRVGGKLAGIWLFSKLAARPSARFGEVYLARAGARRTGAGGTFLDLGAAGEGFLRVPEAAKSPPEGALILATVVQEAACAKAPRLIAGVRLDGRTLRLVWNGEERFERRAQKSDHDASEQAMLRSQLRAVLAHKPGGPARVGEAPDPARQLIASAGPGDRVFVAGPQLFNRVRAEIGYWAPELAAGVSSAPATLFEEEGIEAEIEAALEPIVPLPSGGRLIIEITQALTAIDVDTGAGAAADANNEAAQQIPFEIAARRLAGTILIDFAQLRTRGALVRLGAAIAESAAKLGLDLDIGAGRRGLLDIRRARGEAPVAAALTRAGLTHLAVPRILSLPAQAARIARAVERARPASHRQIRMPPAMSVWLEGDGRAFRDAITAATPARLVFTVAELSRADGFELAG